MSRRWWFSIVMFFCIGATCRVAVSYKRLKRIIEKIVLQSAKAKRATDKERDRSASANSLLAPGSPRSTYTSPLARSTITPSSPSDWSLPAGMPVDAKITPDLSVCFDFDV
jgi:hypothetical protein